MPFDKEEAALSLSSNRILDAANAARSNVCYRLAKLNVLEKNFNVALDIDRTMPQQINLVKQFGNQALKLDISYARAVRNNRENLAIAVKTQNINFRLMVLHGIVSLGKLCEAVLVVFPGTGKVIEVLKLIKTGTSSTKDVIEAGRMMKAGDGSGSSGRAVEGSLKLLGEQAQTLAELIGGAIDVRDLAKPGSDTKIDSGDLAAKAATICKLIKGIAGTLQIIIEGLKHQTIGSVRLEKAAMFLDVFENLLECYKNAMSAVDDYENMMRLAGNIGRQMYHLQKLQGNQHPWESYQARKAFERAIYNKSKVKYKMKTGIVDFSRAIDSQSAARQWGIELAAQTSRMQNDLKKAQKSLRLYAEHYAALMAQLASGYKSMLEHQAKMLESYKSIVEYELRTFGPGRHGSLVGFSALQPELRHYNEVLAKVEFRLGVSAAMSQSRARGQ